MSPPEKRLYQRHRLRTTITFEDESGEGFIYFYSTDISMGGLFFESELPLKQHTKVFLSFKLPTSPSTIRVTGEAVRQEKDSGGSQQVTGTGIRFVDLSKVAADAISLYLEANPHED